MFVIFSFCFGFFVRSFKEFFDVRIFFGVGVFFFVVGGNVFLFGFGKNDFSSVSLRLMLFVYIVL